MTSVSMRRTWCAKWFAVGVVSLIAAACFTASAQATIVVDNSIFSEDFSGTALDSAKWEVGLDNGGTITLDGGVATFNTTAGSQNAYVTSNGSLDFSGSPDNWGAELKFRVDGVYSGWGPRNFILVDGLTTATANGWTNQGFDLRAIRQDSSHFNLAWNGWDNDYGYREPTILATGYQDGVAHVAQVHRRTDGTVDIYMDGDFVSNQSLLGGVNPSQLRIGDCTGYLECNVGIDYVRVGSIVPEPSTIVLAASGAIGLLAYAWRRRK
jgi:hypothetical protein